MTPDGEFTEREVGAALQELKEVRHDYRNLRTIVMLVSEEQDRLRLEHEKLKTRLTTVISVVAGLFTLAVSILGIWKVE
jgi:regulator of replication initiation timing